MAITKAKLIADGVITVDNLNASHGIQTTHISEGTNLYYTDARVGSYLTANNYITTAGGYFSDASLSANILTFQKSDGTTDTIDLSLYLDDTNLARLVSGTLDGQTGIATFTRDDSSTFTIDFSAFLADANDYVSSGSFNTNTGVLTLTRLGGGTVTVDLDGKYAEASHTHLWADITDAPTALSFFTNDSGFLTSFTETDPVYVASSWYTTTNNAGDWDTAYGWGDHSLAGYLTSFTETDPVFTASAASGITSTQITNWDTAYGWGDHASAGYLTSLPSHNHDALYVPLSRTITINGTALDLSADRSFTVSASDETKLPLTGGTLSGALILGSVASAGSSAVLNTNGFIRVAEHVIIHDPANLPMAQGISWDSSTNGLYTYTESATGTLRATGSMRAPIFYDSDNTAHYIDPSGGSNIRNLYVGDAGDSWSDPGGWGTQVRFSNAPHVKFVLHARTPGIEAGMYVHTPGSVYMGSYTSHVLSLMYAGGVRMQVEDGRVYSHVYTEAAGSSRAPVFYDSNDTAFYTDPASGTNFRYLNVDGTWGSSPFGSGHAQLNVTGSYASITQRSTVGALAYALHHIDDRYSLYVGRGATNGTDWSWALRAYPNQDGNYVEFRTSARAQIFYDIDNTGYYVDPAGTSNFNDASFGLGAGNSNQGIQISYGNYSSGYGRIRFYQDGSNHSTIHSFSNGWQGGTLQSASSGAINIDGATGATFGGWNIPDMWIDKSGNSQSRSSSRAPIFYDSNNTGYYLDPASTSNLNVVNYAGQIRNSGSGYKSYNLHGMVGDYDQNSTSDKIIWTIGDSWNSIGNMYGIGYSYGSGYGHHLVYRNNGTVYHRISFASEGAYFTGTVTASGDIVAYSDERTKENVKTIENALDKVVSLRGVEFNKIGETSKSIGVIAQEVEKVLPEVVKEQEVDGMKAVAYGNIVGLLIEAIKEQNQVIEDLKQRIAKLEA